MDKKVMVALLVLAILMFGCKGESKMTSKKIVTPPPAGPTGSTPIQTPSGAAVTGAATADTDTTSAAEAIEQLRDNPEATATSGNTTGNFYPPIETTATGEDALKEKTRALFTQTQVYDPNVTADSDFGPRYHSDSGKVINLPEGYSDSGDN